MGKCICGLDHFEPLPEEYEAPPLVNMAGGWITSVTCHVCGVSTAPSKKPFPHASDCEYALWTKKKVEDAE